MRLTFLNTTGNELMQGATREYEVIRFTTMTLGPKCALQQTQAKAAGNGPPSCYQQTCNYFPAQTETNKK